MKTCPACQKESSNDQECMHCGIIFAKWEKLRAPSSASSAAEPKTSGAVVSEIAVKERSVFTKIGLIFAVVFAVMWFFWGGTSDDAEIKENFQGFWNAMKAGNPDAIKKYLAAGYGNELLGSDAGPALQLMKQMMSDQYKIGKIAIQNDAALVDISLVSNGTSLSATTKFVKESGTWKVSSHTWNLGNDTETASGDSRSAGPSTTTAESAKQPLVQIRENDASPFMKDYIERFGGKSIDELLAALKSGSSGGGEPAPPKEYLVSDLIKRGARDQVVQALNEMLRSRDPNASPDEARGFLERIGEPITFASDKSRFTLRDSEYDWLEWSVEIRRGAIFSSGKNYLNPDVVAGFTRPSKSELKIPVFARYRFEVTGGGLTIPIEKTVEDPRPGEQTWDQLPIASGLGPGKYEVRLFLHAQTVKRDGVPLSISSQAQALSVENR